MPPFEPLPAVPDNNALELEVLELWDQEGTFDQLRERNRGGPKWSFVDGPVTANKKLAIHTAWGRTLKDVFQRYKALQGFDQRYQNGFDCQGLWIEVGVEKQLGLNSKREIEEYGLAEFATGAGRSSPGRRTSSGAAPSGSVSGWTGATTTSPSATRTSSTSGAF
jgi:isoleucyl-tRNA synthetase